MLVQPEPSSAGSSTAGPSTTEGTSRRQPPKKKRRVEDIDPTINLICETIGKQQELLEKITSTPAPPRDTCLLRTFAETWTKQVAKWPLSEQAAHFHKLTLLTEQKDNELKIRETEFDFSH